MTERGPSIWREDEGQAGATPRTSSEVVPDLFGVSAPPQAGPPSADPVDLWRPEEGQPSRQVHVPTAPTGAPRKERKRRTKEERKTLISWRVVVLASLALLVLAVVVDAGLALVTIRDDLAGAASELNKVETLLARGDLKGAAARADAALSQARSADQATRRPSLLLASLIPDVRRETNALEGAVEAAALSAEAARSVVAGATALGLDEEGIPSDLYVDGQVQLATVAEARQHINDAELALTVALLRLEESEPRLEQLRVPIDDAHSRASEALARITDARTSMDLLSSMFGARNQRRYLLAFQAPGEARGTGGLIGFAGILASEDGRLELEEIGPGRDFFRPSYRNLNAPRWFRESYSSQGALEQWQQVNVSPNHEAMSAVLLEMYEKANAETADGVVTMDPIAMEHLMAGVDPIQAQGRTLDETNLAETVLHDSYIEFTPEEQNVFLTDVLDAFWDKISGGEIDWKAFAGGVGEGFRGQHLKLYSRAGSEQTLIEALDLDGSYQVGPNSQMVFNVNYGANKLDYFLHRDLDTRIELRSGGEAQVTTTLRLENRAPAGPASPLLGLNDDGLAPGTNRMTINLLMPPGSVVDSFSVGGEEREPFTYTDEDSPVVWDVLQIPPGGNQTVSLSYTTPNALQVLGGATTFDFSLYPQATVNPDEFSLTISPPPGVEVVATEGGITSEETPSLSGRLEEPISVRLFMEED